MKRKCRRSVKVLAGTTNKKRGYYSTRSDAAAVKHFRCGEAMTPNEVAALRNARVVYYAQRHCDWAAVRKVEGVDSTTQAQAAN
jgi:hypothetical protein